MTNISGIEPLLKARYPRNDQSTIEPTKVSGSAFSKFRSISGTQVKLHPGLWHDRMQTNQMVSLKHGYQMLKEGGNFHNLQLAAGQVTGKYHQRLASDSDVYKWVEAVSYVLASADDQAMEVLLDEIVDLIVDAQTDDGYLMSYYQVLKPDECWEDLAKGHELYCAGHLIQAAIAHHAATADTRLLNVANRLLDHITEIFGVGRQAGTPGHPGIEMALVEFYRHTGREDSLELARFFLEQRGQYQFRGVDPWVFQNHLPVKQQTKLVGHAVRQVYLLSGIADLYLESGDEQLLNVLNAQWDDMVNGKMYITGGLGQRHFREIFGEAYELPTDRCYCESCAAIGSIMWNWRMLLATGESRFADIIEQTLYNGFLSAGSLDGQNFFYANPLMSRGCPDVAKDDHSNPWRRKPWHKTACCPPNIMRLFASLTHYLVTTNESGIQLQQYAPGLIQVDHESVGDVNLDIQTEYPWDGRVKISIDSQSEKTWDLRLRLPSWCREYTLQVNHQDVNARCSDGYIHIKRRWQSGDQVSLHLVMNPVLMVADPRIDSVRGCAAIQRGPVLYCVEDCDCPNDIDLQDIVLDKHTGFKAVWEHHLLGGITTIAFSPKRNDRNGWGAGLYRHQGSDEYLLQESDVNVRAIPYFCWANRHPGKMRVWLPCCEVSQRR